MSPGCMGWLNVAVIEAGGNKVALLNTLIENGLTFQAWPTNKNGTNNKNIIP